MEASLPGKSPKKMPSLSRRSPVIPKAVLPKSWAARTCNECRRRKCGCLGGNPHPCETCRIHGRECIWTDEEDARRPMNRQLFDALKTQNQTLQERVAYLEALLRQNNITQPSPPQGTALSVVNVGMQSTDWTPIPSRKRLRSEEEHSMPVAIPIRQGSSSNQSTPEELAESFGKLILEDGVFYGDISAFSHLPDISKNQSSNSPLGAMHYRPSNTSTPRYKLYFDDRDPGIHLDQCKHFVHLPSAPFLSRATHDTLLDLFFKFYAPWCMRVIPDWILRDMYIALSGSFCPMTMRMHPSTSTMFSGHPSANDHFGTATWPASPTQHYSPMLHNAIIAMALIFSDDPLLRSPSTRMVFAKAATRFVELEAQRPTLATVQALAIISSFYSSLGQQGLGFMYFGLSIRMSQALGLNVPCAAWVASGHISPETMRERNLIYWSCYNQDTCWATYVGRESSLPASNRIPMPEVDPEMDAMEWHWPSKPSPASDGMSMNVDGDRGPSDLPPAVQPRTSPSLISTTFVEACKLLKILGTRIFDVIFNNSVGDKVQIIGDIRVALDEWYNGLPDSVRLGHKVSATVANPNVLMIHLSFWWVMIILYRPLFRKPHSSGVPPGTSATNNPGQAAHSPTSTHAPSSPPALIKICARSVNKIIELLVVWRNLYGLRFCPVTLIQIAFTAGVTALSLASLWRHKATAHSEAVQTAEKCVVFLKEMGVGWESANQNATILGRLIEEHLVTQVIRVIGKHAAGHGRLGRRRSRGKDAPGRKSSKVGLTMSPIDSRTDDRSHAPEQRLPAFPLGQAAAGPSLFEEHQGHPGSRGFSTSPVVNWMGQSTQFGLSSLQDGSLHDYAGAGPSLLTRRMREVDEPVPSPTPPASGMIEEARSAALESILQGFDYVDECLAGPDRGQYSESRWDSNGGCVAGGGNYQAAEGEDQWDWHAVNPGESEFFTDHHTTPPPTQPAQPPLDYVDFLDSFEDVFDFAQQPGLSLPAGGMGSLPMEGLLVSQVLGSRDVAGMRSGECFPSQPAPMGFDIDWMEALGEGLHDTFAEMDVLH